MTEFDLALSFIENYIETAIAASESGGTVDDLAEFRRHCVHNGVKPNEERVELVRDLGRVLKECLADEDGEGEDEEAARTIAAVCLAEGLEHYGWRLSFLNRVVRH